MKARTRARSASMSGLAEAAREMESATTSCSKRRRRGWRAREWGFSRNRSAFAVIAWRRSCSCWHSSRTSASTTPRSSPSLFCSAAEAWHASTTKCKADSWCSGAGEARRSRRWSSRRPEKSDAMRSPFEFDSSATTLRREALVSRGRGCARATCSRARRRFGACSGDIGISRARFSNTSSPCRATGFAPLRRHDASATLSPGQCAAIFARCGTWV
mmetsp:Transcript_13400/g.31418  ORF Transcript_13400/g.31418 Transcript_13400/m.31418 type:complete len:216 (-) Transcript_13400:316-963(-)